MLSSTVKRYLRNLIKIYIFWSIKNSGEILDKLKARGFNATSLTSYDFSTLCTSLPHDFIKDKLIDLIKRTFNKEGSPHLACNDRNAFFTSQKKLKNIMHVCDALPFLLDYILFGLARSCLDK